MCYVYTLTITSWAIYIRQLEWAMREDSEYYLWNENMIASYVVSDADIIFLYTLHYH